MAHCPVSEFEIGAAEPVARSVLEVVGELMGEDIWHAIAVEEVVGAHEHLGAGFRPAEPLGFHPVMLVFGARIEPGGRAEADHDMVVQRHPAGRRDEIVEIGVADHGRLRVVPGCNLLDRQPGLDVAVGDEGLGGDLRLRADEAAVIGRLRAVQRPALVAFALPRHVIFHGIDEAALATGLAAALLAPFRDDLVAKVRIGYAHGKAAARLDRSPTAVDELEPFRVLRAEPVPPIAEGVAVFGALSASHAVAPEEDFLRDHVVMRRRCREAHRRGRLALHAGAESDMALFEARMTVWSVASITRDCILGTTAPSSPGQSQRTSR